VVSYPRSLPPRGYGPREPDGRGAAPADPGEVVRLRSGIALVAPGALLALWALPIGFWGLWNGAVPGPLVYLGIGGYAAFQSLALAVTPLVRVRGWTLDVWPGVLGAHRHLVDATRVEWRRGARYVGRWIRATDVRGRTVRIPVWMMRRRDARWLFDRLDAFSAEAVLDADR
jgi:hypothetical protein